MKKSEIKKELYKRKPNASKIGQRDDVQIWCTFIGSEMISFDIPDNEGKDFGDNQPAQLLIRWLVN